MMKKNIISLFLLALVTGMTFSSCEDMLTPDMDRHNEVDEIATDTLYSYWGILKSLQNIAERYVILGECRGDLVSPTEYVSDSIHAILNFGQGGEALDGDCRYLQIRDYYHIINSCNTYIAKADTTTKTGTNRDIMLREYAQVQSIRAWVYLQLVLNYGRVPYFDTPMLSTSDIDNFWSASQWVSIDDLSDKLAVRQLDAVRSVNIPLYGSYGRIATIADATQCIFPQNLVLGDIYLLKARKGDEATYSKAAQYYYDFLNSQYGGPINPQNYFGAQVRNMQNDQMQITPLVYETFWIGTFNSKSAVNVNNEKVTVIPSSNNKLWGTVLRGVNELFGASSEIRVQTSTQDTTTTTAASISLSLNYQHELGASKSLKAISDAQTYEVYTGETGVLQLKVMEGAGDARYKMSVQDFTDTERGSDTPVGFVVKQNLPSSYMNPFSLTFNTSYPIIYRKGSIWLRFAEALNGAGFPGYAFAILKSGLCGNAIWLPTNEREYEPATYRYYDLAEIDEVTGDTTFYDSDAAFRHHIYERAIAEDDSIFAADEATIALYFQIIGGEDVSLDEDAYQNVIAFAEEFSAYVTAHNSDFKQEGVTFHEWVNPANTSIVCNHISKTEMLKAKETPFLNFSNSIYLRGSLLQQTIAQSRTQYDLITAPSYPLNSGDPVTMGIHSRGCGLIQYDERKTSFNYVDQINRMLATYEGATETMSKEEIYDPDNIETVKAAIADLILDELALETCFEGNRFFDLVCFSRFRGSNDELAKRVATRNGTLDASLRSYLQDESHWFFKVPAH